MSLFTPPVPLSRSCCSALCLINTQAGHPVGIPPSQPPPLLCFLANVRGFPMRGAAYVLGPWQSRSVDSVLAESEGCRITVPGIPFILLRLPPISIPPYHLVDQIQIFAVSWGLMTHHIKIRLKFFGPLFFHHKRLTKTCTFN